MRRTGADLATAMFLAFGLPTISLGQSFNIDIGTSVSSEAGFGPPAATFGGAVNVAGEWNDITGSGAGPFALLDLAGNSTAVTLSRSSGAGGNSSFDNSNTSGNFEHLLDDYQEIGGVGQSRVYTIAGLLPNNYTIYTYAIAPDSDTARTNVSVAGSSSTNPQSVGGVMPSNAFAAGVTHAVHEITLLEGETLTITAATQNDVGVISGIQIVAAQACCFADGSCAELEPGACLAAGGTPQGDGAACAETNCVATCPPDWLPGGGPSSTVFAFTMWDPDDAGPAHPLLIVGGSFTTAGGVTVNRIAAWNGVSWQALGTGMSGNVAALAVYNGELIAGGPFLSAGGTTVNRIARWNGSAWQALGTGMNASVSSLAVYNGELYAGGGFSTAGGVSAPRLARWNGTAWQAAGTSPISGGTTEVRALTVYENELVAGGQFTTIGGVPANRIAAWNGTSWHAFGTGMTGMVRSLTVFDADLIAGGNFFGASDTFVNFIARWDGTVWHSMGGGMGGPASPEVTALTVFENELIAGGNFTTAGGTSASRIARWNGTLWQSLGSGVDNSVFALREFNGQLMVGGLFSTAGGAASANFARWGSCDDGDPCTEDACVDGTCVHTPVDCDDGDPCTEDACDPLSGECVYTPIPNCGGCEDDEACDDGDPCTVDTCVDGECVHTPVDCDDGDPCTEDTCDSFTGECIHTPIDCDDGDPCTVDTCVDGECVHTPVDCDDGDPCTEDTCDPFTGECIHTPIPDCECTITVSLELDGSGFPPELARCIRFELFPADCEAPSVVIEEDVTLLDGAAGAIVLTMQCGDFVCMSASDPLHTLARTVDPLPRGADIAVAFASAAALISGDTNGDNVIDIIDFGVVVNRLGNAVAADTPCGTAAFHADLNGDETIDPNDLDFVLLNFLRPGDMGCCGPQRQSGGSMPPIVCGGRPQDADIDDLLGIKKSGVVTVEVPHAPTLRK